MSNNSNDFKSPEFLEILKQYEDMKKNKTSSCYLEVDAILDISEYYDTIKLNTKEAGEVLDFGLQIHSDDSELKKYKIQNLISQNLLDEAEKLLKTMYLENYDPEIKLIRAALYIQKGEKLKGILLIEKTLESIDDEDDEEMCSEEAGNMLLNAKEFDKAYKILEKANKNFPDNKSIKELYAEACFNTANFSKAETLYNEILDDDPYDIEQWIDLAQTYISMEDYSKAQESLDFASAIDENNTEIDITRATCYYQQAIFDKSYEYYKKAYDKDPNNEIAFMFASACCMNMSRDDEAANLIEQAIKVGGKLSPQFINMRIQAAIIFENLKNYDKAISYLNEAIQEDSTVTQLYILRGEVFIRSGNFLEGEKNFDIAIKYTDNLNECYFHIAIAYYDSHNYNQALSYFHLLHESTELDLSYAYMANCYLQSGNTEKYLFCLQLACSKNPESVKNVFNEFIPEGIAPEHFYEYVRKNWNGYSNNLFKS